ncbi:MAG TPA: TonB-dependent receptor, partial [Bryobacteraceae bacterium]|nr:TonB-dependent receptor [Bryobacteraceae bacterium]
TGGNRTPFDTFQIFGTVTKVTGKHSIKMGTDMRELRESSASYGNSVGRYRFTNDWTRGPLYTSPGGPVGQSLASLMLGLITNNDNSNYEIQPYRTQQSRYYAFFIQDDWRVSSNLTINAGLRYERETGTKERFNRTTIGFDPNAQLAVTDAARAAYAANPNPLLSPASFNPRGGVLFASPGNREAYSTYPYAFAPRFGFAWSPSMLGAGKTVLRGGFGIFYYTIGTQGVYQPGFNARTPITGTLDNYLTPAATLSNPFPTGISQPLGAAEGVNTFVGQNLTVYDNRQAQPYTIRWNFNIQRELSRNLVLELGYMGSRSVHIYETRNSTDTDIDMNAVPAQYLSPSTTRDQATITRLQASTPNPFAGLLPGTTLNGSTVQVQQLLRPFPQFAGNSGVRIAGMNNGYSNYNALMVRLERRYANGLQLTTNYTWSKLNEATRRLNPTIPVLEYRIANEDRPHRWVFGFNYDLPFGRGRHFGGGVSRWVDAVIGGWSTNGIWTIQSGEPINFEDRNAIYLGGDWKVKGHNGGFDRQVFDPTVFNRNPQQQLDLNVRYFGSRFSNVRGDYTNNIDFSIIKAFQIFERLNAQLRGEAFNLANRPQFSNPETDMLNQNFGKSTGQSNNPRSIQLGLRLRW